MTSGVIYIIPLKIMGHKLENGGRPIREPQRRLVEAYLSGYRPDDWPT